MHLQFKHTRDGVIKVGESALATFRSYEQHAPDALEAGGLLIGRLICDCHDVVIDRVTEPMPGDTRRRFGFDQDDPGHGRAIQEAWHASAGRINFLGNWHTHAEPFPRPSPIDVDNWNRIHRDETHPSEARFFVIVGQREIAVWQGDHDTGEIVKLAPISGQRAA